MSNEEYIVVGKILKPHGLAGEVRVESLTDKPDRFSPGQRLFIVDRRTRTKKVIESSRMTAKGFLIKFEGLDSRNEVESLNGTSLQIKREEAKSLGKDEFFVDDIIGMDVFEDDGNHLGVICGIMETGSNDVYIIKTKTGEELLPATKEVVREVSVEQKKMIIHVLPGLMEN